jgi:hypothetical protein
VGPLTATAWDVAQRYERAAEGLLAHDREFARLAAQPRAEPVEWPTDLGQDLYILADLRAWLDGLRDDIARIRGVPEPVDGLQKRAARVTGPRVTGP